MNPPLKKSLYMFFYSTSGKIASPHGEVKGQTGYWFTVAVAN